MFLLIPAHPGSPGQRVIKQLCVCCDRHNFCYSLLLLCLTIVHMPFSVCTSCGKFVVSSSNKNAVIGLHKQFSDIDYSLIVAFFIASTYTFCFYITGIVFFNYFRFGLAHEKET